MQVIGLQMTCFCFDSCSPRLSRAVNETYAQTKLIHAPCVWFRAEVKPGAREPGPLGTPDMIFPTHAAKSPFFSLCCMSGCSPCPLHTG
jgi:hypothetical protein